MLNMVMEQLAGQNLHRLTELLLLQAHQLIPQKLKDQLAIGGRMVIPVGDRISQKLYLIRLKLSENDFESEIIPEFTFVPLNRKRRLEKVIVIVGPTCSGKTKLSLEIAERINSEIISADSRQIYKYLDIGTAKPSDTELKKVKHHFIDELDPTEDFNVSKFEEQGQGHY